MNHLNLALREHIPLICARHLPAAKETVNQSWQPTTTQITQITHTTYPSRSGRLALGVCPDTSSDLEIIEPIL